MSTPTRRAAVLGSPIAHSLSPVLHRAAYAELGLAHWSYDRFEVDEAALPGFLDGLDGSWAGLSLTMPLKRAILPLLDGISDTAASVEAVNTVVFTDDGRRIGDNTDIPGMIAALRERGVDKVDSAAVLGAGATASSALAALSRICSGTGHRVCPQCGQGRRNARLGRAARRRGAYRRLGRGGPGAAGATGHRHHPGRRHGRARGRGARAARGRCSTCCTSRGRRRWPPRGRARGEPSSAASISWFTRRYSRSSR